MDVINRPRQTGKTTELLVRMLANPNAVLLVHDYNRARDLQNRYPLISERIFSHGDFERCASGIVNPNAVVLIDDLDIFLQRRFGGNIEAVTLSK